MYCLVNKIGKFFYMLKIHMKQNIKNKQNLTHYFVVKLQTKERFNNLRLIIHQVLTFKTL